MIFSDYSIREALAAGYIGISPPPEEIQIQPASVDLRLSNQWQFYTKPPMVISMVSMLAGRFRGWGLIDPLKDVSKYMRHQQSDTYVLRPGGFVLGSTTERVAIPADLVARVEGRSSLGRLGLAVHITAGYIDPGFKGNITLEFFNASSRAILLRKGMRICQLSFESMTCAAREPYGTKKGSKYQNQDGAVPSRINKDEK